jgi:hypothetical protein
MRLDDLTGRKFGRLTVLKRSENIRDKTAWLCVCECGNAKVITADNLKRGVTRSCGCYRDYIRIENGRRNGTHHGFGTRIYRIYRGMWQRCYDKNVSQYSRYGGKGIKICDEWLGENGFVAFRNWSEKNGYQDNLSIDRINNNGDYSPTNCRWATDKEQMNNRNCNVFLCMNGEKHTMAEWSDITGISRATIKSRHRAGWNDVDILTKPVDKRKATKSKL